MKLKVQKFVMEEETAQELAMALDEYLCDYNKRKRKHKKTGEPIIVCVGSDLAIYDALGPLCGTLLKEEMPNVSLYGSLDSLQTAKNIQKTTARLKRECPNRPIIAIDAAVGNKEDVGIIEIRNEPLYPGAGAGKKLGKVGEISILGLTLTKGEQWTNSSRLGAVYSMAATISNSVAMFLNEWRTNEEQMKKRKR